LRQLIARQHGIVTASQAVAHGLTRGAIRANLSGGRWQRVFDRVYATFSGPLPRPALLWAVALRAGPTARLSHRTAGELNGLVDEPANPIHVTIANDRRLRRLPGVRIHRSAAGVTSAHPSRLPPQTRVEDTVLDLGQLARTADDAIGWVAVACSRRLTTPDRIAGAARRRSRMRWRKEIERACADVSRGCHSVLELRYLRDVERAHGLPAADRQVRMDGAGHTSYDDVRYRAFAVAIELDGDRYHPDRRRDTVRDNTRAAAGLTVLRYDRVAVTTRPCSVAREVAHALAARGWNGAPRWCGRDCIL
jgi:hypothetical protein